MSVVTHALLVFSYLILAAGVFVLGPSWFGLSDQTASMLALFVFFAAWHIQFALKSHYDQKKIQEELKVLKRALPLSGRQDTAGDTDEASDVVVELRILQGLLGQLEKRPAMGDGERAIIDVEAEPLSAEKEGATISAENAHPLSTIEIMDITQSALIENRVDLYMQPIVYLPSRNVVHYECFTRVRSKDGVVIDAGRYISIVKDKGLAGTLDNLLFFRLIQIIRKLGPRHPAMKFFCNMSKESLCDQDFFPQFADYISNNREFAERIVLEITRKDYDQLSAIVLDQLLSLGRHGCVISLDRMTDMDMDFNGLEKNYVRFVKIDIEILLKTYDIGDIPELVSRLRSRQIYLILSKIESEYDSLQAMDSQVELAQGYLYGELNPAQDYTENF